jgi:hemolysin activation/secretion protein
MTQNDSPAPAPACASERRHAFLRCLGAAALLAASSPSPAQPSPAGATPLPSTPLAPAATLNVTAIAVEGNTLLAPEQLDALTAPALGNGRTLADLHAAAARVQAAYRDAGYGGVVAFVPEQDASSGRVLIRVVEGKLAAVRVKGNRFFTEDNVRRGLPNLREGETPVVRIIDRDLQLSNENPAKELHLTLGPGERPGQIAADVTVQDMKPLQFLAAFSNTGNDATGRGRVSVGVRHANLTDHDDVATLQYQTATAHPSRVHVATLAYHLPFYAWGGSVDAFYAHSSASNGTTLTPIGPLVFAGKGNLLSLRANHNLERRSDLDQRVSAGVDFKDFQNDCSLGVFGAAACGPAGVSVRSVPISVGYTAQRQEGDRSWGVSAGLAVNAGGSDAATFEAARPGATRHYAIARLTAFRDLPISGGWAAGLRADTQYSPHALITAERFGVGGLTSVRGYDERELTGDWGLAVRAELLTPSLDFGTRSFFRLRPLAFLDGGHVANHKGLPCRGLAQTSCSAAAIGLGLRAGLGTLASGTLDVARALRDGVTTARGDMRVHVSVTFAY